MAGTAVGRLTNGRGAEADKLVATRVGRLSDRSVNVHVYLPRPPDGPECGGPGAVVRRQRGRPGRDEDEEPGSRILLRDGRVDRGRIEPSWGGDRPDGSGDPDRLAVHDGRHGRQR